MGAEFIRKLHPWSIHLLSGKHVKNGPISTHNQKVRAPLSGPLATLMMILGLFTPQNLADANVG